MKAATSLQSVNAQFGSKLAFFYPVKPWNLTDYLKNNRTSPLCYFKLCATFHSHRWIQTWVTVRKRRIWFKIGDLFSCVTLKFDRWPWKTIGHLSYATSKMCASFHSHQWIQTGVTVQKLSSRVLTSGTLTSDLWPWPFAWTSLLSLVITSENFMMIRWQEHCEKGVTDGQKCS